MFDEKIEKLEKTKQKSTLLVIKCASDMITASTSSGILERLIGMKANDFWMGIGGSISAAISCYTLYPSSGK